MPKNGKKKPLTPKQQRLRKALATERTITAAAAKAGVERTYASNLVNGENPTFSHALAQDQQRAAELAAIDTARLVGMFAEDRVFAQECKQAGAAVSATAGIGKALGLLIEKQQDVTPDRPRGWDDEIPVGDGVSERREALASVPR